MISAGWSMGSHSSHQRAVGPVIRSVQIPNERMGIGQVGCRVCAQSRGDDQGAPKEPTSPHMRQRYACANRARQRARGKAPFAPPPHRSACGGLSQFFPHISWTL